MLDFCSDVCITEFFYICLRIPKYTQNIFFYFEVQRYGYNYLVPATSSA